MTPEAQRFVEHFGLTDARQCGDCLLIGQADFWKVASQAHGELPGGLQPSSEDKGPWFMGPIHGFGIYCAPPITGTGLTVSDAPDKDIAFAAGGSMIALEDL